ncbi:FG-GAP-like repeat-containing protein [Pseudarthrobacter sp. 1C304]|uniref:FG-GAP-like repeat-containing protein n=1 Tax=Pseudarthrobacter sp. 1C304 TaxID=3457438 RepID=UPI003FCF1002
MKRTVRWLSQTLVMALVVTASVLGVTSSATAASDYGYAGNSFSGVSNPPTSDKPQSKLWWHDGSWWADMWTTGTGWQIYRLDVPTKKWVSTGITNDTRASTLADTLWDGTHLYIASHVTAVSGDTTPVPSVSGQQARLYRYSYSGGTFRLDSGFPTTIMNNSSESMTIDQDSTGAMWATWTQVAGNATDGYTNTVYVNRSAAGGTGWNTPFVLPVTNPNLAPDDISAVVAYGGNKIGIMWSDQLTSSVRWATRTDGTNATAASSWKVQDAVKGNGLADDHINVKTLQSDNAGRVFAAIKTGLNDLPGNQNQAEIMLLVFRPGTGNFTTSTIAKVSDCVSRPQIVLDTENNEIHAFHTGPSSDVSGCAFSGTPGAIYEKTASMDNPVFPEGRGTPIIQDGASANVNDVTTSKQSVNNTTGLVVLASNNVTKRYWFSYRTLGGDPPAPGESMRLNDFNGDGNTDVIARDGSGQLWLYPGTGTGDWFTRINLGGGWNVMTSIVSAGDFNGDGDADVIARDTNGQLWLYRGTGSGDWLQRQSLGGGWNVMTSIVAPGDFNGDDRPDLIARDSSGRLWLYPNNGAGDWFTRVDLGAGWNIMSSIVAPGDFDADGNVDLIARDSSGELWHYPGNGQNEWFTRESLGSGWNTLNAITAPGDMNGDDRPDVIARDTTGELWLYPNNGAGDWFKRIDLGGGWSQMTAIL